MAEHKTNESEKKLKGERRSVINYRDIWFDRNFRNQLITSIGRNEALMLLVWLDSATNLPAMDLIGTSDPYVIFNIDPPYISTDRQQRSSTIMKTLNPKWIPHELFRFIVTNPHEATLKMTVMDWDRIGRDDKIGDVTLAVSGIANEEKSHELNIERPPSNNGTLKIRTKLVHLIEGLCYQEFHIFEYERWKNGQWGHTDDFFKSDDPRRWDYVYKSNPHEGNSMVFEEVAPKTRVEWQIVEPWHKLPLENNPDGWQYSTDFHSKDWGGIESYNVKVRRRVWKQVVRDTSLQYT